MAMFSAPATVHRNILMKALAQPEFERMGNQILQLGFQEKYWDLNLKITSCSYNRKLLIKQPILNWSSGETKKSIDATQEDGTHPKKFLPDVKKNVWFQKIVNL